MSNEIITIAAEVRRAPTERRPFQLWLKRADGSEYFYGAYMAQIDARAKARFLSRTLKFEYNQPEI